MSEDPPEHVWFCCRHCGDTLGEAGTDGFAEGFCCQGCFNVFTFLHENNLDTFYRLRGKRGLPASLAESNTVGSRRDRKWLDVMNAPSEANEGFNGAVKTLAFDVQGIHCSGCVWAIEELFSRNNSAQYIDVNSSSGRLDIKVGGEFDLYGFVDSVERLGYRLGPAGRGAPSTSNDLLVKMGVSLALAGNTMLFTLAGYLGLKDGKLLTLFADLSFVFTTITVALGASVFFRSAWSALRQRLLHFDIPIALGIGLAYAGSVWAYMQHSGHTYFDTVAVFVALMLVGRWLQERVVQHNRRFLLAEGDGLRGLLCRRLQPSSSDHASLDIVPCQDIVSGDRLLVVPGDLVPVEATATALMVPSAFSLDWINGESQPRTYCAGDTLPAGAFNAAKHAVELTAQQSFTASTLRQLIGKPRADVQQHSSLWWRRVSSWWVTSVLLLASLGFVVWAIYADVAAGLEVAIAVLVVTCPCAFGIATPLAFEMILNHLRRAGLFVRNRDFLERAVAIKRIAFDKTGTLSSGNMVAAPYDDDRSPPLSSKDRHLLYNLVSRSNHPKSMALRHWLENGGDSTATHRVLQFSSNLQPTEFSGRGLSLRHQGHTYTLGAPGWATGDKAANHSEDDIVFACDTTTIRRFHTCEALRPQTAGELQALRVQGYTLQILSGDSQARVDSLGAPLGLSGAAALGDLSPEDKACWLRENQQLPTLMIGDGINDAPALLAAHASGTPTIDRPFVPNRSDFFFVTPGLKPIRMALEAAHRLHKTGQRNLIVALGYNSGAAALALLGLMKPWMAAVLMPTSSLLLLALTSRILEGLGDDEITPAMNPTGSAGAEAHVRSC